MSAVERYVTKNAQRIWQRAEVLGVWITNSDVPDLAKNGGPPSVPGWGILDGKVPDQRLAALEAGAPWTNEEGELWRETWINWALSGDEDADVVPGYAIAKVSPRRSAPVYAIILATGYSFTGVEYCLEGIYPSLEAAKARISSEGWHT